MLTSSYSFAGYTPGHSWAHRLDPRFKSIMFLAVVVTALVAASPLGLIALGACALMAVATSGLRRAQFLGLFRILIILAFAAVLLNALFTPGRPLGGSAELPLWPTVEGTRLGLLAALRLVSMACVAFLLVSTTSPRGLGDTVEACVGRIPRLRGAGLSVNVACRFTPDLIRDAHRVKAIKSVRTGGGGMGPIDRLKIAGSSVLPLMVSAVRRAERMADAMTARCYEGPGGRTKWRRSKTGPRDWGALSCTLALCVLVVMAGAV